MKFFIHSGDVRSHEEMNFMRRDSSSIEHVISNELLKNTTTKQEKKTFFKIRKYHEGERPYVYLVQCLLDGEASMKSGESLDNAATS